MKTEKRKTRVSLFRFSPSLSLPLRVSALSFRFRIKVLLFLFVLLVAVLQWFVGGLGSEIRCCSFSLLRLFFLSLFFFFVRASFFFACCLAPRSGGRGSDRAHTQGIMRTHRRRRGTGFCRKEGRRKKRSILSLSLSFSLTPPRPLLSSLPPPPRSLLRLRGPRPAPP